MINLKDTLKGVYYETKLTNCFSTQELCKYQSELAVQVGKQTLNNLGTEKYSGEC